MPYETIIIEIYSSSRCQRSVHKEVEDEMQLWSSRSRGDSLVVSIRYRIFCKNSMNNDNVLAYDTQYTQWALNKQSTALRVPFQRANV